VDASRRQLGVSSLEHMSGVVEASSGIRAVAAAHDDFFRGWISSERGWRRSIQDPSTAPPSPVAAKVTIIPTLIQHQTYATSRSHLPGHLDLTGVPAKYKRAGTCGLVKRAHLQAADYAALRKSRPIEDWFVRYYHAKGGGSSPERTRRTS